MEIIKSIKKAQKRGVKMSFSSKNSKPEYLFVGTFEISADQNKNAFIDVYVNTPFYNNHTSICLPNSWTFFLHSVIYKIITENLISTRSITGVRSVRKRFHVEC